MDITGINLPTPAFHFKDSTPELDQLTVQLGQEIQDQGNDAAQKQKEINDEINSENAL